MLSDSPRVTSEVILVTPAGRGSPAMPPESRAICHTTVVNSGVWEQPGEDRHPPVQPALGDTHSPTLPARHLSQ